MWHLNKPTLKSAKDDLDKVIVHCRSINKSVFEKLYDEYDSHNGAISDDYHNNFINNYQLHASVMKEQYKKTYEGGELSYIRDELTESVYKCPYCGFGEPTTLDHYLPESVFYELATCRLNLVPICWKCNKEKNNKDYHGFVHSYYQEFDKNVVFFKCNVNVEKGGILLFDFYIDGSQIDEQLRQKLENQLSALKLHERLSKECVSYILDNFGDNFTHEEDLKFFISDKLRKSIKRNGYNDWQTALLNGLYVCDEFNIECLKDFINKNATHCGI